MHINATMLGQMLTFAIFVWFTMKFIWPMLMEKMQERKKFIADGLAKAEQGEILLEEAKQKIEQEFVETKQKIAKMLEEANVEASRILDQARKQARDESQNIIESGHANIKLAVTKAKEELFGDVAELVITGAEKIIKRSIDPKEYKEELDELIKTL